MSALEKGQTLQVIFNDTTATAELAYLCQKNNLTIIKQEKIKDSFYWAIQK
jgi:TusA-related sulfurtransferase